jgi:hypothetical protein
LVFPDSSGRSSLATSLTSSDPFNLVGHSPCYLIPSIEHSTITTNSSFNIRRLIAANSSFRVRLPPSRCNGPRSPSPFMPRDRYHALPLRVGLSSRAQAAEGPAPLSPLPPPASRCARGVLRPLRGTRGSRRFTGCRSLALDEADGAQCAERDVTWTALRVIDDPQFFMVMWD